MKSVNEEYVCKSFPAIEGNITIFGSRATLSSLKTGFYYMPIDSGTNFMFEFLNYKFGEIFEKQNQYKKQYRLLNEKEKQYIYERISDGQFLYALLDEKDDLSNNLKVLANIQKEIIDILNRQIGFFDFVSSCKCYGSSDGETVCGSESYDDDKIKNVIKNSNYIILNGGFNKKKPTSPLNYFYGFLKRHPEIKHIIGNKERKETCFAEGKLLFDDGHIVNYYALPSTSGGNKTYQKEECFEYWKKLLDKILEN